MRNLFRYLLLFFVSFQYGIAQEAPKEHRVSKGETIYQISRLYNVSPRDIFRLNPEAVKGIKINQVIRIPKSLVNTSNTVSSSTTSPTNTTNQISTYTVIRGDSKWGLSKRYGISIAELEAQNPHIVNGLQAGHILNINTNATTATSKSSSAVSSSGGRKTHFVLKGETLWGISKANGISVDDLRRANANILTGILQIGQTLRIPSPEEDPSRYVVVRGDTKWGLSKRYNVTIAELEQQNPHIVSLLMAGHIITIPNSSPSPIADATEEKTEEESTENVNNEKETEEENPIIDTPENNLVTTDDEVTDEENPIIDTPETDEVITNDDLSKEESIIDKSEQNSGFIAYTIKPKETLYGLAKRANMNIAEFVKLNPQIESSVQIGMVIKMPSSEYDETDSTTNTNVKIGNQRYTDLSKTIVNAELKNVALFVPFSSGDYDTYSKISTDFSAVKDGFLRHTLEFYRGAQIAVDSAKSMGINFDLKLMETSANKENTRAERVAKSNDINTMDLVILPFYENDTEDIAKLISEKGTPVITIATPSNKDGLENIFEAIPSVNTQRQTILNFMVSNNGNIIVINDAGRTEGKSFIASYTPQAKFLDLNKNGTFITEDLISLLSKDKKNYVIIESTRNSVFLSSTTVLLNELSSFSIELAVLDEALIPDSDDVSRKRYVILKMLYPSLSPAVKTPETLKFQENYKNRYQNSPSKTVMDGFDIMFDNLLRVSQSDTFEASVKTTVTEYSNLKFEYQKNGYGGYSNRGVYILQYDKDSYIKEVN